MVIISIVIPFPSVFQSSPRSTPSTAHVSLYLIHPLQGCFSISLLRPMSRKPIELCHLEGHLNYLIAPRGTRREEPSRRAMSEDTQVYRMRKSFHRQTWRTCKLSSGFSSVVIILMYILPLQFKWTIHVIYLNRVSCFIMYFECLKKQSLTI